jgi:hypothetical protein
MNDKRQPIPPLNLEELKFWLRIMEEHALFIKAGLPCDSVALITEADNFRQEFAVLRDRAERVQSQRQFAELVGDAQTVVGDFYRYKRRLLHMVLTCQLPGHSFALFLDHVSREAEYFLMLLATMGNAQPLYQAAGAREVAFWLRLMADHSDFISHRLDPSERTLQATTDEFACEFDELYLQGRDFVSMLRGETDEVPSFRRFLKDARVSTVRLRDFKRAVETLIAECRLLGTIPAELADHVRREADHFLLVLAILEKGAFVPFVQDEELEYVNLDDGVVIASPVGSGGTVAVVAEELADAAAGYYDEDDEYDDDVGPAPPRPPRPAEPEPPPPPEIVAPPAPEPAAKPAKHKWSGKWPRPLGSKG